MKKFTIRYRALSTLVLLGIVAISLMFTFLVGKKTGDNQFADSINGNVFYWIIKAIAILWILILILLMWINKGGFSKIFPLTLAGILYQGVPALTRIGFATNHFVATWIYFAVIIISLIIIPMSILYSISNDQFRKHENNVPTSSNKID